jgi:hypothetical protein
MTKPKTFRPWLPGHAHLLPPSPIEWLPSDHLVFVLRGLPNEFDFSAIMAPALAKDPRAEEAVKAPYQGRKSPKGGGGT